MSDAADLASVVIDAGRPLELGDAAACWRVVAGRVEVFAVIEDGGHPIGNRAFVAVAGPGDLMFAGSTNAGERRCGLRGFAADPATVERARDPDAAGTARWVAALARAVADAGEPRPAGGSLIAAGEVVPLPDSAIVSARELDWVRVEAGTALLFGDVAVPLGAGGLVPLSPHCWLTGGAGGATVAALDDDPGAPAVTAFQRRALACLMARQHAAAAGEAARIRVSAAWSAAALDTARAQFAGVLERHHDDAPPLTGGDAFVGACSLAAQALGDNMPVHAAPDSDTGTAGVIERIARLTRKPVREVTLYGRWWQDAIGTMIGFRADTGTAIALIPRPRGDYRLHDAASGERLDPADPACPAVAPTAYLLYPTLPDRRLTGADLLRFGLAGSRRDIVIVLATALLSALLTLVIPLASGTLVDVFIPGHLKPQLWTFGLMLLLVTVVAVIVRVTGDLAQLRLTGRISSVLQPAIVDRALRLPSDVLKRYSSADLSYKVLVIDKIRRGLGTIAVNGLLAGLFSVTSLLLLLVYAPLPALVALLFFAVFVAVALWAGYAQLPALQAVEDTCTTGQELSFQFVEGIGNLRTAAAEERAFAQWSAVYADHQAGQLLAGNITARFAAFAAGYEVLSLAALFAGLTWFRVAGTSTGDLVIVVAAYAQFVIASTAFGTGLLNIFLMTPKFRALRMILDELPEVGAASHDPGAITGRIGVSNLSFGYVPGAPPVIDHIDLTIEPGQFVAFVGPSGGGKSTMMRLLLGFETPRAGAVYYDGRDLARLDLQALRRQIGVVLQHGKPMAGTIGENILGVSGGTSDAAWEAARMAGLAGDIEAMPMGMHTVLTDGASTLSGGQLQRLLIARALAGRPRVLFLDEATSALDNRTQSEVTASLRRMAITRIVIAHRLSTVADADCIFVLAEGRVVQRGTYAELIAQPGPFAELARRQIT